MNVNLIIILNYFFSTMIIFGKNSLYSIINLIFLIVGSCCLLFCLNVEFLSFILLIIYIGAISVLFLFVVMMLQLDSAEKIKIEPNLTKYYLIYFVLFIKFAYFILFFNKQLCVSLSLFSFEFTKYNKDVVNFHYFLLNNKNDNIIFLSLFDQKFLFFIIIGFSLLFSMIGSIALCLTKGR